MEYRTAGESHGKTLVAIVTGVPAGVPLTADAIGLDLARRQVGYGRGGRMAIETDRAVIQSGVRFGVTIGSPVALTIGNRDWDQWTDVMATEGAPVADARVTTPRPGHADLPGCQRTGSRDVRDVLERASARETAARVAAGAVARALLSELGVRVDSWVERIGGASVEATDTDGIDLVAVEASDVRCPDPAAAAAMRAEIDAAREAGESVGGVFVVRARGVVAGLGGYASPGERLDAALAAAVMSIPAIKGFEIGDGFSAAAKRGSAVHDPIAWDESGFRRTSNHAGGIEGGMSNGETVVVRAAMKPIPTLMKPLATVDLDTHEKADAARERSDVCAVPAAAVVAEAEVAMVLADAYVRAFGDRCLADMASALESYRARISR